MRPIRFAAYNKATKEIELVLSICFINRHVEVLPERNLEGEVYEYWHFDHIELMQYTGLNDKGGTEIYEGNIIRTAEGYKYIVFWDDVLASFCIRDVDNIAFSSDLCPMHTVSEVVGHIYLSQDSTE